MIIRYLVVTMTLQRHLNQDLEQSPIQLHLLLPSGYHLSLLERNISRPSGLLQISW